MKKLLLTIAIILMATATSWATIVSDDGSGADANPIGGNWTPIVGGNALKRANNKITGTATNCISYWNANSFSINHFEKSRVSRTSYGATWVGIVRIPKGTYQSGLYCRFQNLGSPGQWQIDLIEKFNGGDVTLFTGNIASGSMGDTCIVQATGAAPTVLKFIHKTDTVSANAINSIFDTCKTIGTGVWNDVDSTYGWSGGDLSTAATISYSPSSRIDTVGVATLGFTVITSNSPDSVGFKRALPVGYTLNHVTGNITASGTPTTVQPATLDTMYVWKGGTKNDSTSISIEIVAIQTLPTISKANLSSAYLCGNYKDTLVGIHFGSIQGTVKYGSTSAIGYDKWQNDTIIALTPRIISGSYVRYLTDNNANVDSSTSITYLTMPTIIANSKYLAPWGNDSANGTFLAPWKTVSWATCGGMYHCACAGINDMRIGKGDTLFFRGGTYYVGAELVSGYPLSFDSSGTATQKITLRNAHGEVPVINGEGRGPIFVLGWNNHQDHIVFDSLWITNGHAYGISVGYNNGVCNDVTIRNCNITHITNYHDNCAGVVLENVWDSVSIYNNYFKIGTHPDSSGSGIEMFRGTNNFWIYGNVVDSSQRGIYIKRAPDNTRLSSGRIYNNFIQNTTLHGIAICSDSVRIYNNLIVNGITGLFGRGITIYPENNGGCANVGAIHNKVTHNTIYNYDIGLDLNQLGDCPDSINAGAKHNFVRNNLISTSASKDLSWIWVYRPDSNKDTNNLDSNMYYSAKASPYNYYSSGSQTFAQWKTLTGYDFNSIFVQPTFVNGTGNLNTIADFKLTTESAGHNAASDGMDIGATQRNGVLTTLPIPQYTVTATSGGGGTIITTTPLTQDSATVLHFTARANSGYQFVNWTGSVTFLNSSNGTAVCSLTTTSNQTVTANFRVFPPKYTLTMAAGTGGTVTPASGEIDSGATININGFANSHYDFLKWTRSGISATVLDSTNKTTTAVLTNNSTITGNFEIYDSVKICYPNSGRIDKVAKPIIRILYHGSRKATANTVIHAGGQSLGKVTSYTDSTVTDTANGIAAGYYRIWITDPSWTTMSDTLLNAFRALNPSIIVTNPR